MRNERFIFNSDEAVNLMQSSRLFGTCRTLQQKGHYAIWVGVMISFFSINYAYADVLASTLQSPASPSDSFIPDVLSAVRPLTDQHLQPETTTKVLSLSDCIQIALTRHPETKSSWYAIQSSIARVGEEKSSYLPSVDFTVNGDRAEDNVSSSVTNTYVAGLNVRYLLFDGGERASRLSGARDAMRAAGFQHNTVLQKIALKVEEAYYGLLAAKWSQNVAEETLHQAQYHVELAVARFDNGLVSRSDVLKAQTEKANASLGLVTARNAVRIAAGELVSTMGLKVYTSINIADISQNAPLQELEDIAPLLDEALRNQPKLRASAAMVRAAETKIQESESQNWPKISADAGYGWRDDSVASVREGWSVGLNMSVPLFTGFKNGYRIDRARADTQQEKAKHEDLQRDVELEVWTAYSRVVEAREAITAADTFVVSAKESARLAEGEYKSGATSIIALIDARTALTSARNSFVQARFSWYIALAYLEKAVGRYLPERLADGIGE